MQPKTITVPSTVSFDDLNPLSGSESPGQKIADIVASGVVRSGAVVAFGVVGSGAVVASDVVGSAVVVTSGVVGSGGVVASGVVGPGGVVISTSKQNKLKHEEK